MRLILALFLTCFSLAAVAEDIDEIKTCLKNWKNHPFKAEPEFRILSSKVKVMGIGDEATDSEPTEKPDLVLIKPSVNVMSKSVIALMNPNGWYCLKGKVAVLGKTQINLHCKAHLTSSTSGATVLGSDKNDTGVTVLGKTEVVREGCPVSK